MFQGLIYFDDFIEVYIKLRQRGIQFLATKLNLNPQKRTLSSFTPVFPHANWWIIPKVQSRTNEKITGHQNVGYEEYITEKYIQTTGKVLLSMGCGVGSHEIKLAQLNPALEIRGYDVAPKLIDAAKQKARSLHLHNAHFFHQDIYQLELATESVDYFLFNSSLHHVKDIDTYIGAKIYPALRSKGLVFINEYVGPNRMQFTPEEVEACNCAIRTIPPELRKILNTHLLKTRVAQNGRIRMILADPSECVDSVQIIPTLEKQFTTIERKGLGGNILMPVLKHIAHHFVTEDPQPMDVLNKLFLYEDDYLITSPSNYMFAVFQKQ